MNYKDGLRLNEKNRGGQEPSKTKKYWFLPKTYGYGVVPISIEGWGITLLLFGVVLGFAWWNNILPEKEIATEKELMLFIIEASVSLFASLIFSTLPK